MRIPALPPNPFTRERSGSVDVGCSDGSSPSDSVDDKILVFPRLRAEGSDSVLADLSLESFANTGPERRTDAKAPAEPLDSRQLALLASDRQARVEFFAMLEGNPDKSEVLATLHSIIAAEGPQSHWFLRKNAFEYLRKWSDAPLSASLRALASSKDDSVKGLIMSVVMQDLSFPISSSARGEVSRIGALGGELCNRILVDAPAIGDRPMWVSRFPQFVRTWILACAAVGVEHGVDANLLNRFSRNEGGPLNDWHIRHALEPLSPLSWGGFQSFLRRVTRH